MTDNLFEFAARGMKAQAVVDKLCHKQDPCTSRIAAEKMIKSGALARQEQEVYGAIRTMPGSAMQSFDFTTKEIALRMSTSGEYPHYYKCYDICRRRFSGLYNKGKIKRTGEKRNGCMIWKLK